MGPVQAVGHDPFLIKVLDASVHRLEYFVGYFAFYPCYLPEVLCMVSYLVHELDGFQVPASHQKGLLGYVFVIKGQ